MREVYLQISVKKDYYLIGARTGDNVLVGSVRAVICRDLVKEGRPFMIMENIIVDSGWHRKGIGSMLIRAVESIVRERDCIFVQFCSSSFRTGALVFYAEAGYSPDVVKGFRKYF